MDSRSTAEARSNTLSLAELMTGIFELVIDGQSDGQVNDYENIIFITQMKASLQTCDNFICAATSTALLESCPILAQGLNEQTLGTYHRTTFQ